MYVASIISVPFLEKEVGIVDISLSFNNDCDRQPVVSGSQSDSRIVFRVVCFCFVENCVSVSFGSGVKFKLECNAL